MWKRILFYSLIIFVFVFLAVGDRFSLEYYQKSIALKWAEYGTIPVVIISLVLLLKNWIVGSKNIIKTLFAAIGVSTLIGLIYFFQLSIVVSGSAILINSYIGKQKDIEISGIVVEKKYLSQKDGEFQVIVIKSEDGFISFQTHSSVVDQYQVGNMFREELKLGSLGLLSRRKYR